jgi:hypothetical protein
MLHLQTASLRGKPNIYFNAASHDSALPVMRVCVTVIQGMTCANKQAISCRMQYMKYTVERDDICDRASRSPPPSLKTHSKVCHLFSTLNFPVNGTN